MPWLMAKAFGLPRALWLVLIAAALIGLYLYFQAAENADDKANQEVGAAVQREGDLRETLERTEKADEIREEFSRDDRAVYDECLRSARTPANCERFLPDRQDD